MKTNKKKKTNKIFNIIKSIIIVIVNIYIINDYIKHFNR